MKSKILKVLHLTKLQTLEDCDNLKIKTILKDYNNNISHYFNPNYSFILKKYDNSNTINNINNKFNISFSLFKKHNIEIPLIPNIKLKKKFTINDLNNINKLNKIINNSKIYGKDYKKKTRKEIEEIFDKFEKIEKINKNKINNITKNEKENQILKMQEKSLKKYENEKKTINYIKMKIKKKIKRKNLMMDDYFNYRYKSEKKIINDKYKNQNEIFFDWSNSLRNINNNINKTNNNIKINKNKKNFEIIRKPDDTIYGINSPFKTQREKNKYNSTQNIFRKKLKIKKINLNNYKFNENDNKLQIIGKKLLDLERQQFNESKGKNFYIADKKKEYNGEFEIKNE